MLNDITTILLRFRLHKFAVATDIEKAFLQIGLEEQDRDMTRFFWLSDMDNPQSELITYRFKAVLFGAICSPFILNATLLKHIGENPSSASETMMSDLYVDNILSSFSTETDLSEYYSSARALMSKAGFNLRSWASNSNRIKVLGLRWNVESDTLTFGTTPKLDTPSHSLTKREILSDSSKIFDPLGLLSPITVRCKILMQNLWSQKLDWDEKVAEDIKLCWSEICNDLGSVVKTEIPRCYFAVNSHESTELHVFVDASKKAYGACAYLVNGNKTSFVMAKTRVAPLKNSTIPLLELMAAVIRARLASHITSSFKSYRVILWSDSQITLSWLSSSKQLKTFVANRVKEIKSLTDGYSWRYYPTKDNPADILSRGMSGQQFKDNTLWFNGPEWLTTEEQWPQWKESDLTTLTTECETAIPESTPSVVDTFLTSSLHKLVDITKYSSFIKLVRVTAYVLRFIRNCRKLQNEKLKGTVSVLEIQNHHCGLGSTITLLRQRFWIPAIRQLVNSVLRKCVICRKVSGKPYTAPDPPPLPKDRVTMDRPFTVTGVDFSGALYIKSGKGSETTKVYICLFTCANTRAVHLEIVPNMTEESFLMAFRRFISKKSLPRIMIPDNDCTFVAAAEDIKHLFCIRNLA
ncbi:uncharacterized protein LOC117331137 [Pecten maximus]|uniref:uncharacterized protein LOC117331137 n=1 Tax=Pecten maximus TaxID=6579 RepID=UPI001458D1C3|nr:uncharacterized protein LOC117331137 [Pecten maximus]